MSELKADSAVSTIDTLLVWRVVLILLLVAGAAVELRLS